MSTETKAKKTKTIEEQFWCTLIYASRDEHRRKYSDFEWAKMQPKGANFKIGDVVEFHVGGFGVIRMVSPGDKSGPPQYATQAIDGLAPHKRHKTAWHYEGDFKRRVAKSPLHRLAGLRSKGN